MFCGKNSLIIIAGFTCYGLFFDPLLHYLERVALNAVCCCVVEC